VTARDRSEAGVRPRICFHGIGRPARALEQGETAYWITPSVLERILDLLDEQDVDLSFDDGNLSDVEIALPALQQRGLKATFFVLAGRLDTAGSLSPEDVRRLCAAGMKIGSHGMNHVPWVGLDRDELHAETVEARRALAEVTEGRIEDAALPLGRYDRRLLGELRKLDYRSVSTSDRRWAKDGAWLQPRFSVRADDSPESFCRAVLTRRPLASRSLLAAKGVLKRLR